MAKTINWSKEFYDEIYSEDCKNPKIALRLGSLYFDNSYYLTNEIVDIRIDHKIARKGIIISQMELMKIKDIPEDIMQFFKKRLNDKTKLINYLSNTYNREITEETVVTLIPYKNLPLKKETI